MQEFLAYHARELAKTGITPVQIQLPIQGKLECLEAAKALPGKGYLPKLQSANGRVRKKFNKDTNTLEVCVEYEDTRATMKDYERTTMKTMVR